VHLDGGCDIKRYHFIFNGLKQYKSRYDMIGLSVYPYWDIEAGLTKSDQETLDKAIANICQLYREYGKELMIVETGYNADEPEKGKKFLSDLIEASVNQTEGHCKGVFYWAPELEGHYKLGAFRNHRPTVIMDAYKEASLKLSDAKEPHNLITLQLELAKVECVPILPLKNPKAKRNSCLSIVVKIFYKCRDKF
jgi:arabinogalactan endo-1,4-beta-galactosidase